MKTLKKIMLLLLVGLFAACGNVQDVSLVKFEDVQIKDFKGKTAVLIAKIKIDNPNKKKVIVKDVDAKILISGNDLGKIKLSEDLVLAAQSNQSYEVKFHLDINDSVTNIYATAMSLMAKKDIKLKAVGTVKGKMGILSKRFPVEIEQNVPINIK